MPEKTTNSYELLVIFAGSLRESELKKELEKLEAELAKDVKVLNKATWPLRPLAYKIAGETTGNYFIANFEAAGEVIAKLENMLRLDQKIIRHLIAKTPKSYEWREYSEEDLEHDHTKLDVTEPAAEPRFVKKKPAAKKPAAGKPVAASKPAAKKIEKKPEAKSDTGTIDKKLDDILADL